MLRAAVAAKTPLGIKAKEAMDKVRSSYILLFFPVVLLFYSICSELYEEIANMTLLEYFRENLFQMT